VVAVVRAVVRVEGTGQVLNFVRLAGGVLGFVRLAGKVFGFVEEVLLLHQR